MTVGGPLRDTLATLVDDVADPAPGLASAVRRTHARRRARRSVVAVAGVVAATAALVVVPSLRHQSGPAPTAILTTGAPTTAAPATAPTTSGSPTPSVFNGSSITSSPDATAADLAEGRYVVSVNGSGDLIATAAGSLAELALAPLPDGWTSRGFDTAGPDHVVVLASASDARPPRLLDITLSTDVARIVAPLVLTDEQLTGDVFVSPDHTRVALPLVGDAHALLVDLRTGGTTRVPLPGAFRVLGWNGDASLAIDDGTPFVVRLLHLNGSSAGSLTLPATMCATATMHGTLYAWVDCGNGRAVLQAVSTAQARTVAALTGLPPVPIDPLGVSADGRTLVFTMEADCVTHRYDVQLADGAVHDSRTTHPCLGGTEMPLAG
jgi:hypothetical protein